MPAFIMFTYLIYGSLILGLGYLIIILVLIVYWRRLAPNNFSDSYKPSTGISVVIPMRNEATHIPELLVRLTQLNYPFELLDIILINDHSTDETNSLIAELSLPENLHLYDLPEQHLGKKAALEFGIQKAQKDWIVTLDADCLPSRNWLLSIAHLIENQSLKLITGPVIYYDERNHFERFQSLDNTGMMVVTGAAMAGQQFYLANGANLAFERQLFLDLDGYEGNKQYASGDDMFLVKKIVDAGLADSIRFNRSLDAVVLTKAQPSVKAFVNQRVRWGAKNKHSTDLRLKMVLAWMFVTTSWIWASLILFLTTGSVAAQWAFWVTLLLKIIADGWLLWIATASFHRRDLMRSFFVSFLLHTIYLSGIGLISLFAKRYEWKGRKLQ